MLPNSLVDFGLQVAYLFSHITVLQLLDIGLVTLAFFAIFQALYQTRTLQLLRGIIVMGILGAALLVMLPLETFSWLVRALLLAGVIVLPILFQDDLRRILVSIGRLGSSRPAMPDYEHFKKALSNAVWQLAEERNGALLVLEGQTQLDDIIATGIALKAEALSSELLLTIFFPKTPLHDGAVVFRGDRLVAASCILPVQQESTGEKHLGTRHRAALGLSRQVPDALVILVSEETGRVSVAYGGKLHGGLTAEKLDNWVDRYSEQFSRTSDSRWDWLRGRGWRSNLSNLLVALFLALIAWVTVMLQTNPPVQVTLDAVPVVVSGPDKGLIMMEQPPATVKVRVQGMKDRVNSLESVSARAELATGKLPAGTYNLPFNVTTADPYAEILSVKPASANLTLEPEVTLTLTPTVVIPDLKSLPPGYAVGSVSVSPQQVTVTGPESLVQSVKEAQALVWLGERRTDFQEVLNINLLDDAGHKVDGVQPSPATVLATLPIQRSFFTREVAVQANLNKSALDRNYEISQVRLSPDTVTLVGPRSSLDAVGNMLMTEPISLTRVYSQTTLTVPLVLPRDITALGVNGESIKSVTVQVDVAPIAGYLVLARNVVAVGQPLTATVTIDPARVSILLIGPKPLLDMVSRNPELVVVTADLAGLQPGQNLVPLDVQTPPGLQVQLFPTEVNVTVK